MKTTTAPFLYQQGLHNYRPYKSVDCFIRVWDTDHFEYEVASTDLLPYLEKIGEISWTLDTEQLNVWRLSNITLTFKNTDSEFDEAVATSIFYGKYLHKSKIEIKAGYKDASTGVITTLYVFTGAVVKDPIFDKERKTVVINVSGLEYLTQEADAQKVANTVTDEALGNGDGTTAQVFTTANNCIGIVDDVKVNGVLQYEGVDYSVYNLDDPANPAQIIFNPAPPNGLAVTASYRHWKQNVTLKSVVESLLTEGGFTGASASVDSALFYYGEKTQVWNSKDELEASTRSRNVDTATSAGDILHTTEAFADLTLSNMVIETGALKIPDIDEKYECNELPESATPAWTKTLPSGAYWDTLEINPAGILHGQTASTTAERSVQYAHTETLGTFIIKCKLSITNASATNVAEINCPDFIIRTPDATYVNGYIEAKITGTKTAQDTTGYHEYWVNNADGKLYVDGVYLCTVATGSSNTMQCWKYATAGAETAHFYVDYIYRDATSFAPAGNIGTATSTALDYGNNKEIFFGKIFKNDTIPADGSTVVYETQTGDASDFTGTNDAWRTVVFTGAVGVIHASTVAYRYLRWRVTVTEALYTSPTIAEVTMPASILLNAVDCGANLNAWVLFECWNTLNSQEVKSYTTTSADGVTYDAEVLVSGTTIGSDVHRYIRCRNIISKITAGTKAQIHRDKIIYKIQSFDCYMANFKDKTVQQAIEDIAMLVDYEIGITTAGVYFFRSKTASAVVDYTFTESADIIQVRSVTKGWDRVANHVTVDFGGFRATSDQFLALDAHPNSEELYGKRFVNIGGTNLLVDPTINVAKGICQTYFTNHKAPKKTVEFVAKTIFQIDLGDTIQISYAGISTDKFKVVAINLNLDDWTMAVTAWEI